MNVVQMIRDKRQDFYLTQSSTLRGGRYTERRTRCRYTCCRSFSASPARIWGSALLNVFFFFSIALGGVAFSAMQDIVGAVLVSAD